MSKSALQSILVRKGSDKGNFPQTRRNTQPTHRESQRDGTPRRVFIVEPTRTSAVVNSSEGESFDPTSGSSDGPPSDDPDFYPASFSNSLRAMYVKCLCALALGTILSIVSQVVDLPWISYSILYEGYAALKVSRKNVYLGLTELCWEDNDHGVRYHCGPIKQPSASLVVCRCFLFLGNGLALVSTAMVILQLTITSKEELGQSLGFLADVAKKPWALWSGIAGMVASLSILNAQAILKVSEGGSGTYSFFISLAALFLLAFGSGFTMFAKTLFEKQKATQYSRVARGGSQRWNVGSKQDLRA